MRGSSTTGDRGQWCATSNNQPNESGIEKGSGTMRGSNAIRQEVAAPNNMRQMRQQMRGGSVK